MVGPSLLVDLRFAAHHAELWAIERRTRASESALSSRRFGKPNAI
jgi:hypothetical protein